MRYRWVVLLVLVCCLAWSARSWAEPSAADAAVQEQMVKVLDEQPEKIFQLADEFQAEPYGEHSMAIVSILTQYGIASKKITLTLGTMIQPFSVARKKEVDLRLFGAYWTGLLVYAVEHDGKGGDTEASNIFAVHYLVKTYRAMLKIRPTEREAYADQLATMSQNGKLAAYVHHAVVEDKKHPMQPEVEAVSPSPSETPTSASSSPAVDTSATPSPTSPSPSSPSPEPSGASDHPSPSDRPSPSSTTHP